MTDRSKKITELTALTNATGDDLLVVVDSPAANAETKKITLANFFANVASNTLVRGSLTVNGNITLAGNTTVTKPATLSNTVTVSGSLLLTGTVPANSTATGTTGQIAFDSNYVYCCISTNTWKRAALTTW